MGGIPKWWGRRLSLFTTWVFTVSSLTITCARLCETTSNSSVDIYLKLERMKRNEWIRLCKVDARLTPEHVDDGGAR